MTLVPWAGEYIGLPFAERGRTREGVDCWGLVRIVLSERYGVDVPSYAERYECCGDVEILGNLVPAEAREWLYVPIENATAGDVIVLRMRGRAMHVGIIVGDGKFLHAREKIGSCLEDYRGPMWAPRVVEVRRHPRMPA